ncbi:MAG TPA: AraC family transcriptional regulator [Clostridia bacterium]|nr:AraC family transcriptional regulator [Clostridia bacterium]
MESSYEKRGYLLEDFRLFHLRDPEGPKVGYHYHEFHKLVFLLSGAGTYVVEGRRYVLRPGDIVLVGRGAVHKPEIGGGSAYERVIVYISPEFVRAHSTDDCNLEACFSVNVGSILRPEKAELEQLTRLIRELERELNAQAYGGKLMCRALFLRLMVELGRNQRRESFLPLAPVEPGDGKMLDILTYLNDHLAEDMSIDALAKRFYVSKYHMMRRFRKETGFSIHGYVSDKRLLLARDLIARGESATDACYRCGYKSYSSFLRAYVKLFGCTPTGRQNIASAEYTVNE